MLSGGQRQRIGIARSLVLSPVLACEVRVLLMFVQAQVIRFR